MKGKGNKQYTSKQMANKKQYKKLKKHFKDTAKVKVIKDVKKRIRITIPFKTVVPKRILTPIEKVGCVVSTITVVGKKCYLFIK